MTDRYVIVYRDGAVGHPHTQPNADWWLGCLRKSPNPPAYRIRIRIREKPRAVEVRYDNAAKAWRYCDISPQRIVTESTYRPDTFHNLPDTRQVVTWPARLGAEKKE
jgi:hypothetical protein